jgi:hypothetical protein
MYGLDNAKKAISRKHWNTDEDNRLLALIKAKKPLEEIAALHMREVPGIKLRLQKLATDFYFYQSRTYEEITKFTGLNQTEIEKAITKRKKDEPLITQTPRPASLAPTPKKIVKKLSSVPNTFTNTDISNLIVVDTPKALPEPKALYEPEPTMKEIMTILLALNIKVKALVPDDPEPTMRDLMKVVKDIQKRLDTLIERVQ